jgi:hypothetical protein
MEVLRDKIAAFLVEHEPRRITLLGDDESTPLGYRLLKPMHTVLGWVVVPTDRFLGFVGRILKISWLK